ncbi:hypothetical protein QTI17_19965 [Variovorax sp. J31P179]|uniref:hypothetical protein n=1 Tax=Variovorax sp. J31P179 TaxID=3053508 RepID=UPI002574BFC9|nr:hypothetical protein [Variovorax sp. J31P179]MDM0082873.1 hypothetical protein [Variovorax sp. J31P179]
MHVKVTLRQRAQAKGEMKNVCQCVGDGMRALNQRQVVGLGLRAPSVKVVAFSRVGRQYELGQDGALISDAQIVGHQSLRLREVILRVVLSLYDRLQASKSALVFAPVHGLDVIGRAFRSHLMGRPNHYPRDSAKST